MRFRAVKVILAPSTDWSREWHTKLVEPKQHTMNTWNNPPGGWNTASTKSRQIPPGDYDRGPGTHKRSRLTREDLSMSDILWSYLIFLSRWEMSPAVSPFCSKSSDILLAVWVTWLDEPAAWEGNYRLLRLAGCLKVSAALAVNAPLWRLAGDITMMARLDTRK